MANDSTPRPTLRGSIAYRKRVLQRRRRELHVGHRDGAERTVWLCSWQRSGSTWLAELLATPPRTRLLYEPANVPDGLFDGAAAAAVPLAEAEGPVSRAVVEALRENPAGAWIDQLNTTALAERRVVKDVRALGVAGDVAAAVPQAPIIVLLRHPFAVAHSAWRLGWTASDDRATAFRAEVDSWTRLHERALRDERLERAYWITYEELNSEPERHLGQLRDWLIEQHPTWSAIDLGLARHHQRVGHNLSRQRPLTRRRTVRARRAGARDSRLARPRRALRSRRSAGPTDRRFSSRRAGPASSLGE
jgi:hypothetical protein